MKSLLDRVLSGVFLTLVVVLLPSPCGAEGSVNLVYGPRYLDDELWDSIDGDEAFGIDFTWGKEAWPVRIAFGAFLVGDDNDDECIRIFSSTECPPELAGSVLEREIFEFSVGVARYWQPGNSVEINLGGGLSSVEVEVESSANGLTDDDSSDSFYAQAGIYWSSRDRADPGGHFHLGVDFRYVTGSEFTVFDFEVDADYHQIGVVFGGGW
jgi:hypothetical protein